MKVIEKSKVSELIELGFGVEVEGGVELSPLEVAYLHKEGLVEEDAEVDPLVFKVYSLLRDRGYIVRECEGYLRLFKKGYRRGEDRSFAIIKVLKQGISLEELEADIATAKDMKKELIYAYEKGGVVRFFTPIRRSFP